MFSKILDISILSREQMMDRILRNYHQTVDHQSWFKYESFLAYNEDDRTAYWSKWFICDVNIAVSIDTVDEFFMMEIIEITSPGNHPLPISLVNQ